MKILNGLAIAGYIKERQVREVNRILKTSDVIPKLAIVQCRDDPIISTYIRLKQKYGSDISVIVDVHRIDQSKATQLIKELNHDKSVNGIIVQLPLDNPSETEDIVNLVLPSKDVDALGKRSIFDPATPTAILWLLAGYNIDLNNKKILIIGNGRLVGRPLSTMLKKSGFDVTVADSKTEDLKKLSLSSDIIITATGSPAILSSDMIKRGAVVVDAGVATDRAKRVGDLDETVYKREDLTITPKLGGVGPLTICSLFANVIKSAQKLSAK
ncbi:MAG TPA: bifunctional 5,10-methylenetetrahydrofolate dehydrogenase/5,10-methenyltetrahydrofolate cyclohydrolase [Candidatus Saccharimonadia bacterium]|nr:bifunctional 5,10-methylenetetrahydrofolate dehydrogenase/5,10-methenyltetrahydrofolate cyclohydrolase [Candidatus Saccharimonadia bacterium]